MQDGNIIVDFILEDEEPPFTTTSGINEPRVFTTCVECKGTNGDHLDGCGLDRPFWDDVAEAETHGG